MFLHRFNIQIIPAYIYQHVRVESIDFALLPFSNNEVFIVSGEE